MCRVMTWNIHSAVGADKRSDLQRAVELIRRHAPDIAAIQEVDSRISKAGSDGFERLAAAFGPHSAEARLIAAPDGDYGHAVISRWPLTDTVRHDISFAKREPRAAIQTTVVTPSGPLHLIAAHLGLSFHERRHQAALLRSVAEAAPRPLVVLGDFNDWLSRGSVQRALAEVMPGATRNRTFPARFPIFALDRIYCRPASLLLASWTDVQAWKASDHLPVIADLKP